MSYTPKDIVKTARKTAGKLLAEPWYAVGSVNGWRLSRQLARELTPGHKMHGRKWHAIARAEGADDVLFVADTGEIADVHLTWAAPGDGNFPAAGFHKSVAAFAAWLAEEKAYVAMIEAQAHAKDAVAPGSAICQNCGADWGNGQVTESCAECGGFALVRSCPVCSGRCGAIWRRAVMDSNDDGDAHWVGSCAAADPFVP